MSDVFFVQPHSGLQTDLTSLGVEMDSFLVTTKIANNCSLLLMALSRGNLIKHGVSKTEIMGEEKFLMKKL